MMGIIQNKSALTIVQGNDVKAVQQLTLVLVDTLHLTIKHGFDVDSDAIMLTDVGRQCLFIPLQKYNAKITDNNKHDICNLAKFRLNTQNTSN